MSHTLRFSAFIAMVMLSFALAFHAVFHTCDPSATPEDLDPSESISQEFEECALNEAFGSFGDSFVTMFSSALGGPDFDLFDDLGGGCRCNLPDGAQTAGIFLMVVSSLLRGYNLSRVPNGVCFEKYTLKMNVLFYFGRRHR